MKCAVCHHPMVKKTGEIDLRIGGKLYLARNVAYEECLSCGEKVLSPQVSQELFERIELDPRVCNGKPVIKGI